MMKKIILYIAVGLIHANVNANSIVHDTIPTAIKHLDVNKDNIISFDETKETFQKYLTNNQCNLNDVIDNELEYSLIDVVSFIEKVDFSYIKRTSASNRFLEVYFNNKFLANTNAVPQVDSLVKSNEDEHNKIDEYFKVEAQIVSLHQRVLNPSKKNIENGSQLPNAWPKETMVICDLPINFTPWKNGVFNITPEYTGGNAIGNAVGMGSYVNGIFGAATSTPILLRAQFSQTFEAEKEDGKFKSLECTIGKIYFSDLFDYNAFSGDSYVDFLNYSHLFPAAWDAASTLFGFTYGGGMKVNFQNSQLNFAALTVNKTPAGAEVDWNLKEGHSFNLQYVKKYKIYSSEGSVRVSGFYNKVLSGKYTEALTDTTEQFLFFTDSLKKYQAKIGCAIDADLKFNQQFGLLFRFSLNDGKTESMHYTEADQSVNLGLVYNFGKYKRPNDLFGVAVSSNSISKDHRNFIEKGGSGFMLLNGISEYKEEFAVELFYNINLFKYTRLGINYQYIMNPGYDKNAGNTGFVACRLNFTFD